MPDPYVLRIEKVDDHLIARLNHVDNKEAYWEKKIAGPGEYDLTAEIQQSPGLSILSISGFNRTKEASCKGSFTMGSRIAQRWDSTLQPPFAPDVNRPGPWFQINLGFIVG